MRKIGPGSIAVFLGLTSVELSISTVLIRWAGQIAGDWIPASFRGIVAIVLFAFLFLAIAIAIYRVLLCFRPIPRGELKQGSREEFWVFVYQLEFLLIFNYLLLCRILPALFMRLYLQALGAKLGPNSFSVGTVFDPHFVTIGSDTLLGFGSILCPHIMLKNSLSFGTIKIGSRVTVSGEAIIMGDVEIGDDAVIAIRAVVVPGTRIGAGEYWGGAPARRLKKAVEEPEPIPAGN